MIDKVTTLALICLGASVGSLARFSVYAWVWRSYSNTFWATIIVNIIGSFLIGILFVIFNQVHSPRLQLLLVTGLLASFTTFSTLSLDALKLLSSGQTGLALAHVGTQIFFGISFCFLGVKIGEKLI